VITKGEVGEGGEGRLVATLSRDIVRGVMKGFPCLCVGTSHPVYHKGKWSWRDGWYVGVQDGMFLRKDGSDFNLYWEE
jgi:hypothetical protein